MVVTNLCGDFQILSGGIEGNPVATINHELVTIERRIIAHHDAVIRHIKLDDIQPLGRGDTESFALADGVKFDTLMMTEHLAGKVYNLATMLFHEIRLLEKFA